LQTTDLSWPVVNDLIVVQTNTPEWFKFHFIFELVYKCKNKENKPYYQPGYCTSSTRQQSRNESGGFLLHSYMELISFEFLPDEGRHRNN